MLALLDPAILFAGAGGYLSALRQSDLIAFQHRADTLSFELAWRSSVCSTLGLAMASTRSARRRGRRGAQRRGRGRTGFIEMWGGFGRAASE